MSTDNHYDVIIIGTGAGGGTMAHELAPTGKKILLLERGGFLPKERENWDTRAVFTEKRYQTDEIWYHMDEPFRPAMHYWVGGNTKMYGAALFRLREADFGEIRHVDGISPAWPISYNDLAPYYTRAEHLFYAHGQRGTDPTEPPTDDPYPYPPLAHEPRIAKLEQDLRAMGYRPFPLPLGVRLGDDKPYPQAKTILSTFDGYPDLTESKADAHVAAVKPALEHPSVTLMTDSYVEKLETSASGREVTGVVVRRGDA
ncbi:MAG: GMC family oxidoreductase, partial [Chloroflexi bacterium]|nr:GMC family oxidoreductase [Chloroflexota bacterium]